MLRSGRHRIPPGLQVPRALECPVCLADAPVSRAGISACGHTLCVGCIIAIFAHWAHSPVPGIPCPTCRAEILAPGNTAPWALVGAPQFAPRLAQLQARSARPPR